jgi:hypothetical protein
MKKAAKNLVLVFVFGLVANASANECHEKLKLVTSSSISYGTKSALQKAGKEYAKNVDSQFDDMGTAVFEADKCVKYATRKWLNHAQFNFVAQCKDGITVLSQTGSTYGQRHTKETLSNSSTPDTATILGLLNTYQDQLFKKCM